MWPTFATRTSLNRLTNMSGTETMRDRRRGDSLVRTLLKKGYTSCREIIAVISDLVRTSYMSLITSFKKTIVIVISAIVSVGIMPVLAVGVTSLGVTVLLSLMAGLGSGGRLRGIDCSGVPSPLSVKGLGMAPANLGLLNLGLLTGLGRDGGVGTGGSPKGRWGSVTYRLGSH